MTEQPTEPRDKLPYTLPYPGGGTPLYIFWQMQNDPRDVDKIIEREADDRYHALKDEGRIR